MAFDRLAENGKNNSANQLVPQEFWNRTQGRLPFERPSPGHLVRQWIETFLPPGSGAAIEIGCYPGQFLTLLGDLGYQLNGIDLVEGVDNDLPQWLKDSGFKIGKFHRKDFFNFTPQEKYAVVLSVGFIEHFVNWQEVVNRHLELVENEGYLLMATPNFKGIFQRIFQYLFNRQSYKRHNIDAMSPQLWVKLQAQGFEIIASGYFGKFYYWVDEQKRNIFLKILVHIMIDLVLPIIKVIPFPRNKKIYSPMCMVVGRRVQAGDS